MIIGIDARGLDGKKSGIPLYIENIIKEINKKDKKNKYILYSNREINLDVKLNENIIVKQNMGGLGSILIYFKLPKILKEDKVDLFFGTQHCLPRRNKYTKGIKFVLTIHDLAIKKLKTVGSFKNTIIQTIFTGRSIKNADKIIAISNATKNDIVELYNVEKDKISIIYNGTNFDEHTINLTEDQKSEIRKKFKIENSKFIFFLSTIEPRKNIETLIKAFDYIKVKEKMDLKLILAGGLGWKYENILKQYESSKFKDDIIMPGYISKEEKEYLYKNAECFVYPSLYEGFGLPILEAMSNKQIVITANNSSLPEVRRKCSILL